MNRKLVGYTTLGICVPISLIGLYLSANAWLLRWRALGFALTFIAGLIFGLNVQWQPKDFLDNELLFEDSEGDKE